MPLPLARNQRFVDYLMSLRCMSQQHCQTCVLCHRPDYKKLGILKQQFPDVPVIALTATATETVCQARPLHLL